MTFYRRPKTTRQCASLLRKIKRKGRGIGRVGRRFNWREWRFDLIDSVEFIRCCDKPRETTAKSLEDMEFAIENGYVFDD